MRIDTTRFPHRKVVWLEKTESTMLDAAGHPPGTVVVADQQTAGQGRQGHRWHSEPGTGLYFSTVESPPCTAQHLPVATLALGIAVQEAIRDVAGIGCDIRWPNDLLIGSKKCAGILATTHGDCVIAGIGINVNQRQFTDGLSDIATSLRIESGQEHDREELLAASLRKIDFYLKLLSEEGPDSVLRLFAQASSYVYGRRVCVDTAEASITGVTDGLDASGFLYIRTVGGERRLIRNGGVRPV